MIYGSGPSKDIEAFRNFEGTRIACDRMYHECVEEKIIVDYLVTLEDGDFVTPYFKPPHQITKPTIIMSLRTSPATKVVIDEEDFPVKIYTNEILNACYSVGTMAWMYAWDKLCNLTITLNGFDSLHQYNGYDLLHHLWRDLFWELYEDYCPKDVETIFDDFEDTKTQRKKDSISLDRIDSKYPGFGDGSKEAFKTYIRYRRDRNDLFIHKLKMWEK